MFDETGEVLPPKLTHLGTYVVTQEEQNMRYKREKNKKGNLKGQWEMTTVIVTFRVRHMQNLHIKEFKTQIKRNVKLSICVYGFISPEHTKPTN